MPKILFIQSMLLCGLLSVSSQTLFAETTLYLVRHAEKADDDRVNPSLSEPGRARADCLARVLRSAGIDQCIATQFIRTQATVEPTARSFDRKVLVEKAGTETQLIEKIRSQFADQQILIAGHSNTVPAMLRALGIADPPKLDEADYDSLFVVRVSEAGLLSWLHLHYGAPNPKP